jgi:hypothetical protein
MSRGDPLEGLPETLAWTEEGLSQLQRLHTRGSARVHLFDDGALCQAVAVKLSAQAEAWRRGLERSDAVGQAAVSYTLTAPVEGALPADATAVQAAGAATMLGAYDDEQAVAAFAELLIRRRGLPFAMEVLAHTWLQKTSYHDPQGPRHNDKLMLWMTECPEDHSSHFDPSVSYGKARMAVALSRRVREMPESREPALAAVAALWNSSSPAGRAALVVAARDHERAAELVAHYLATQPSPWPFYGWDQLPSLLCDVDLLERARRAGGWNFPDLRMLENIGAEMIEVYERVVDSQIPNTLRVRVLEQMCNLHGPRTARCFARFAEKSSVRDVVRAYFAAHVDLLPAAVAEPEDGAHADRLVKLENAVNKLRKRQGKHAKSSE